MINRHLGVEIVGFECKKCGKPFWVCLNEVAMIELPHVQADINNYQDKGYKLVDIQDDIACLDGWCSCLDSMEDY